ncbi:MAG: radical SAM protein [Oscillospiraceae bacterium]|nr:radical SAM protein [Oscillospiraceae bacterium]
MSAIIPVFIPHVGCPHDCVFCNQKKIAGTLTAPTAEAVDKIIRDALLKCGGHAEEIAFYGGSFTAIPKEQMTEYLRTAKSFVDSGSVGGIRLSTRPDSIDDDVLSTLRKYGVTTVELGTQSMDDSVLKSSGRGHSASDTVNAAALVKKYGFKLILQMMTHLPGSDDVKDIETARKVASLSPDGVRIYPTVVIRDTALETLWKSGRYTPATPEQAAELGGKIIEIFKSRSIPIIRFGLNPTDDLSSGEALCGAYHPALGEMAISAWYLRLCIKAIDEKEHISEGGVLDIFVSPNRVSAMSGQKKRNKKLLFEKYGFTEIYIHGSSDIKEGSVCVRIANKS